MTKTQCAICKKSFNNIETHKTSKKHKKNVEKLGHNMKITNVFGEEKNGQSISDVLCGWIPDKNGKEYPENVPVGDMCYINSKKGTIIRIRNLNGSHTNLINVIFTIPDIGDTLKNKKFDNIKINKEHGMITLDYTTYNDNKLVLFINNENYKKLQQWKKTFEMVEKLKKSLF